jgi:CheY-like chemotaxis protein
MPSQPRRVLLAEHNEDARTPIESLLHHFVKELRIDAAADYPTAAHLLRKRPYHIVVIHASLPPREGGIALMRDVRLGKFSAPAGRTPTGTHLILTSSDSLGGLASLCDAQFLEKPSEPREFVDLIRGALDVAGCGTSHPHVRYLATPLWWQVVKSSNKEYRWQQKLGVLFRDPAYAAWVAGECDRLVRSGLVDESALSY